MFSVDSFRENGKCLWSVEQICCFRGGKGARFIISAFSRYKVYKISDLTQSNRYSLTLITFEQRYLAWDQGPLWGKKAKTGVKWEKHGRAERYPREGFLIPRLPLGSLHSPFFFLANADIFSFYS